MRLSDPMGESAPLSPAAQASPKRGRPGRAAASPEVSGLQAEIEQGQREGRVHRALARLKGFTHRNPALRLVHKVVVTVVGGVIVLAGIVMLVTPGPGWLGIFLGLGVLATEYPVVHRFNQWAKGKVLGLWHRWREAAHRRRERRAQARRARMRRRAEQRRQRLRVEQELHARHCCAPHRGRGPRCSRLTPVR